MTALYFGWPAFRNRHLLIWGGGGGQPPHYIHPWQAVLRPVTRAPFLEPPPPSFGEAQTTPPPPRTRKPIVPKPRKEHADLSPADASDSNFEHRSERD